MREHVFWAVIGALLLLPAMQSLIHANFDGATRKEVYALDGAAGPAGPAARP